MSTSTRLSKSFQNVPVLPLNYNSRYVLFSDCHRGRGNSNDNFLPNEHLYYAALKHYYQLGYTYVELGDGDELWENRNLSEIMDIHSTVYSLLSLFSKQERLYMIYGNHDMEKKYRSDYYKCYSGLILKDSQSNHDLYLTHGHQAELLNSVFWRVTRFLVRYVWTPLEGIGIPDPTSAAKNYTRKEKTERRLADWAVKESKLLITGHTHRPRLAPETLPYFNTGSCVHPHSITCIEVDKRALSLIEWTLDTRRDKSLYVARKILAGPFPIDQIPNGYSRT